MRQPTRRNKDRLALAGRRFVAFFLFGVLAVGIFTFWQLAIPLWQAVVLLVIVGLITGASAAALGAFVDLHSSERESK
jgi:hypothetical protein